jgi:hypothetical protein
MPAAPGVRTDKSDISLGLTSAFGLEMVSDGEVCTPDVGDRILSKRLQIISEEVDHQNRSGAP